MLFKFFSVFIWALLAAVAYADESPVETVMRVHYVTINVPAVAEPSPSPSTPKQDKVPYASVVSRVPSSKTAALPVRSASKTVSTKRPMPTSRYKTKRNFGIEENSASELLNSYSGIIAALIVAAL